MTKSARPTLIYDGECAFCTRGSARLQMLLDGRLDRVSSHAPGALDLHPSLTREKTQARLYLLLPDGRIFGGAEALARTLALAPWGRFALAYYLPGVASLLEAIYVVIGRNRYRWGKIECDSACSLPQGEH